jgi:hypothetical protein
MENQRAKREKFGNFWANKYEPQDSEWEEERNMIKHHANVLKPGGILVVSYDGSFCSGKHQNGHAATLRSKKDVEERIVKTSGLKLYGGEIKTTPVPGEHCIGIVFLKK